MALFYSLSPESVQPLPDRQQAMLQVSTRNLAEVIKTHSLVINRHKAFRAAVLDMANLEHLRFLLSLNITPDELLSQLKKWQTDSSFHKLHQAVEVVALRIKAWLKESPERSPSETLKTDVRCCLQK
ncbi:hypothetical protein PDJAM_G00143740, partial [Pangasius djambal]|nr:hypothetical protein [Pangasius djambal]